MKQNNKSNIIIFSNFSHDTNEGECHLDDPHLEHDFKVEMVDPFGSQHSKLANWFGVHYKTQ